MFLFRKKNERANTPPESEVDLSQSLGRALHNPLKESAHKDEAMRGKIISILGVLENTFFAIDRIKELTLEASHLVLKASATDDLGNRALMAEKYDELRQIIDQTISESDQQARALIGPEEKSLTLQISQTTSYTIPATRLDCEPEGLNLVPPLSGFSEVGEVSQILRILDKALARIDAVERSLMKDARHLTEKISALDSV